MNDIHHVRITLLFLLSSGFCHAQDATGGQATANGRTTIIAAAATIGGIVLICLGYVYQHESGDDTDRCLSVRIALWKYTSKRRTGVCKYL